MILRAPISIKKAPIYLRRLFITNERFKNEAFLKKNDVFENDPFSTKKGPFQKSTISIEKPTIFRIFAFSKEVQEPGACFVDKNARFFFVHFHNENCSFSPYNFSASAVFLALS